MDREAIRARIASTAPRRRAGHTKVEAGAGRPTGERPWWAKAKPGELTKIAQERADAMSNTKVGRTLKPQIWD